MDALLTDLNELKRAARSLHILGIGGAPPPFSSGISVITASVVSTMAAIEAAFCRAERVPSAGSTMPASGVGDQLPDRRVSDGI